jgi:hypothetical protein
LRANRIVGEPVRVPHLHQLTIRRAHLLLRATVVKFKNPERLPACHRSLAAKCDTDDGRCCTDLRWRGEALAIKRKSGGDAVRWALVPVTAFGVWFGTLLIGIGGSSLLDSLCPPDLMISGICTAPWHGPAMHRDGVRIAAVGFIVPRRCSAYLCAG